MVAACPASRKQWRRAIGAASLCLCLCLCLALVAPARAQSGATDLTSAVTGDGIPDPSIARLLPPEIGGLFGLRKALAGKGVQFGVNYIGEGFRNTRGGIKRGFAYEGRVEFVVDANLKTLLGVDGLEFHANGFQIHGRGPSKYLIGDIEPTSNIEATRSTRLYEAWFDQTLFDHQFGIRIGQMGADGEFISSNVAGLFVNGTFGWPTIFALNQPSFGPAYPLATPGVRLRYDPNENFAFLAALFNGDPAGPPGPGKDADPQVRNRNGLRFRLKDPPFVIAEAQAKYRIADKPGSVKIGMWHHFGGFADYRFGTDLLSLADPASNGLPIRYRGDNGVYGLFDQQVYDAPGDDTKGIAFFVRASASPNDRNLVSVYVDGGINFTGIIPGRPNDGFGLAAAYVRIARNARAIDRDMAIFTGNPTPVRAVEGTIEATYNLAVVPGVSLQPTVQYVLRPAGGVVDASDPLGLRRIHNALALGLRSTIRF